MKGYPNLELDIVGTTAIVKINRPPANTWSEELLVELKYLISDLGEGHQIRCLIVTGAGEKYFSAGADLQRFRDATPADAAKVMERFAASFDALASFSGVTIAAINGYALGGGLECALACDFRIVEEGACLGLPEVRVGVLPGGGGTQRLPRLVGKPWAKRIILMGEQIDAGTALRIGLADEVVPRGRALGCALQWAAKLDLSSPAAFRACKTLIDSSDGQVREGFLREQDAFVHLFETKDQKEGVSAFFEKRKPAWTDS